jgi:hypothetical protein
MAINKAFLGHSLYAEGGITQSLARYGYYGVAPGSPPPADAQRIDRFVQALKDMQVATLWLQLFSRSANKFDSTEPACTNRKALSPSLRRRISIGSAGAIARATRSTGTSNGSRNCATTWD